MARRFVTYNTEDQAAGLVNVDEKGVLNAGSTLPKGASPYMQLVTDGEGQAKWEQRLGYTETEKTELVPETTITVDTDKANIKNPFAVELVAGRVYEVTWDGTVYTCTAFEAESGPVGVGNSTLIGGEDGNNEPFFIAATGAAVIVIAQTAGTHTVSILGDIEIIHLIPGKYVSPVVNVISIDGETYAADKTYAEIAEMLSKGIFPVCILDEYYVLNLCSSYAIQSVMPYVSSELVHNFCAVVGSLFMSVGISDTGTVSVSQLRFATE